MFVKYLTQCGHYLAGDIAKLSDQMATSLIREGKAIRMIGIRKPQSVPRKERKPTLAQMQAKENGKPSREAWIAEIRARALARFLHQVVVCAETGYVRS